MAQAQYGTLRLLTIPQTPAEAPQSEVAGKWVCCSPEAAAAFSAVGFHFGEPLDLVGFDVHLQRVVIAIELCRCERHQIVVRRAPVVCFDDVVADSAVERIDQHADQGRRRRLARAAGVGRRVLCKSSGRQTLCLSRIGVRGDRVVGLWILDHLHRASYAECESEPGPGSGEEGSGFLRLAERNCGDGDS